MSAEFNPNSSDAMFALILERLNQQDILAENRHKDEKATTEAILAQCKATNGRVTKLELWRSHQRGWLLCASAITSFAGAALVKYFVH